MADVDRAAHAARLLSMIIAGLALAFAAVAYVLNPQSIGVDVLRLVAIVLVAFLTARGVRWARLLLIVLTGFAALFAVLTALSRSLPLWGKVWFFVYGAGTVFCLVLLFVAPAAAHFSRPAPTSGDA
jgi:uncharacterized membrane protein (UPF0136 family)